MGMFLDNNNQLTNNVLGIMVAIILVLSLFSTIFSGVTMKASFEGLQSDQSRWLSGARDLQFAGSRSDLGARDSFFGRPEPPVFYQIGDTELVRSDRVNEKVDKPSGFEGLEGIYRYGKPSQAKESFDAMKLQGFDPARYMG